MLIFFISACTEVEQVSSDSISTPTSILAQSTIQPQPIPQNILDRAHMAGLTPEQVVNTFRSIQKAVSEERPQDILEFLDFPLTECSRCQGTVIRTPEDFLAIYPNIMDEETKQNIASETPEDLFIRMGVMMGGGGNNIWFGGYEDRIVIEKFLHYCRGDNNPSSIFDESDFSFGTYTLTGCYDSITLDNVETTNIAPFEYITLETDFIETDDGNYECDVITYEFCEQNYRRGSVLVETFIVGSQSQSFIEEDVVDFRVFCDDKSSLMFDLINRDELFLYIWSGSYCVYEYQQD